jgi:hypothetical protein
MFGRRDSEFVVPSAAFKDCSLPIAFMVPDLTDTDPLLIQVLCATISEAVFKELTDQEVVKSIAISSAVASVAFGDVSTDPLVKPLDPRQRRRPLRLYFRVGFSQGGSHTLYP